MGKGDRSSRRGKISRGSFGNTRPKPQNARKLQAQKKTTPGVK
jgi:ribosomal small subunit protein bTHX